MSINFVLNDIFRRSDQSFSYIKTISFTIGVSVFFIYISKGMLYLFLPKTTTLFNFSTYDVFSKFVQFLIYAMILFSIIWMMIINHSIISSKVKDIAVMKAVGTLYSRLFSFYMLEIFLIDAFSFLFGIFLGFSTYLVLFLILSNIGYHIVMNIDYIFIPLMVIVSFLLVYFINGNEIRNICDKKYSHLESGDIQSNYRAVGGLKLVPKWISRISFKVKIAVTSLVRKKNGFLRMFFISTIVFSIILTFSVGTFVVGNSLKQQINRAQSGGSILIGNKDVLDQYKLGYESFSQPNIVINPNLYNLTESQYLFNQSFINSLKNSSEYQGIDIWTDKIFTFEPAHEMPGWTVHPDWNTTLHPVNEGGMSIFPERFPVVNAVGQNRHGIVPVVGIEFKNYTNNWSILGNINTSEPNVLVGDTLAHNFFQAALYEKMELLGGNGRPYNVSGIFFDSFYKGNATYAPLSYIQKDFNIPGQINLAVLHINNKYDSNSNRLKLLESLNNTVKSELGPNFEVIDISNVFQENINSINNLMITSIVLLVIMLAVIIQSFQFYQKADFQNKIKDFLIIRAIGGKSKLIKRIIFYENFLIILIAGSLGFGISLLICNFLLLSNSILPNILYVLLTWAILIGIVIGLLYIGAKLHYRKFIAGNLLKLSDT